jgi:hypothetical protein
MFQASSCPPSGAQQLQQQPLVYRWNVGGKQCCWSWLTALLPPRSNGKSEAAAAVVELLMMGVRMSGTCWAVFIQVINPRNYCIWLVNAFEYLNRLRIYCPNKHKFVLGCRLSPIFFTYGKTERHRAESLRHGISWTTNDVPNDMANDRIRLRT